MSLLNRVSANDRTIKTGLRNALKLLLTVVFVDSFALLLEVLEFALVTLQVADSLADKSLELLQDDHTINPLFTGHLDRVDGHNPHVLFLDLLRSLRQ